MKSLILALVMILGITSIAAATPQSIVFDRQGRAFIIQNNRAFIVQDHQLNAAQRLQQKQIRNQLKAQALKAQQLRAQRIQQNQRVFNGPVARGLRAFFGVR